MAQGIAVDTPLAEDKPRGKNYINATSGIASWLLTVDHKRIALMYLVSTLTAFAIGGTFALLLRIELLTAKRTIMSAEMYNQAFTLHGAMMVFLFIIPGVPGVLGNFLVPLMIGAKDVAFPKLNLLSLYLYWTGAIFTLASLVQGGLDTGWTFYVPYSSTTSTAVISTTFGVFILGFSSILTGLNFIVTIHKLRAPGDDLVPPAVDPLGGVLDQHRAGPRDAGARHHAAAPHLRARVPHRHLRPGPRRRPGALPALLLVLQPPGRLHHDPPRHGDHQ